MRPRRPPLFLLHTPPTSLPSPSPPPKAGIPSASCASNAVAASAAAGALPSPAAVVADIALATPRGARRRVAGTAVRTAHPPLQAAAARAIDARASRAARGAVAAAASLPRRRRRRRWTARMPGPVPVRVDVL